MEGGREGAEGKREVGGKEGRREGGGKADLRYQVVTSKHPKLGLSQELFFSRICESTTGYTFTPCVGSFYFPWHRHQTEGTTGF